MAGICAYGAYIPRYRLDRKNIFEAMGWINPATAANARGEKAVANYDEDSITMAVAAACDCLKGVDRDTVQGVFFASTTSPYLERLNAGILGSALALREDIRAGDCSGGLRSGTTALLNTMEMAHSGLTDQLLVCAADTRIGKPGSAQEMIFGDAAAAFLVGTGATIADYEGSFSITCDFVDHYRGAGAVFDRQWEDRWIRDMGYHRLIPQVIEGLLQKLDLKIADFSTVVYPCHYPSERKRLNKMLGIDAGMEALDLMQQIGDSGTAHALVMLAGVLESARPGDRILLVGFGNGCDAIAFRVTDRIAQLPPRLSVSGHLSTGTVLQPYEKYLVWRNILPGDLGTRAEVDQWTRWSVNWRNRKAILGLWGSRCARCGTVHFPPQRVCVNPSCGSSQEMADVCFSDKFGRVISYTGDNLAASYDPPAIYGSVEFDIGGRSMFDFTDCDLDSLSVGMPVSMSFRKKYYDQKRGISGYFWKAIPNREETVDG